MFGLPAANSVQHPKNKQSTNTRPPGYRGSVGGGPPDKLEVVALDFKGGAPGKLAVGQQNEILPLALLVPLVLEKPRRHKARNARLKEA